MRLFVAVELAAANQQAMSAMAENLRACGADVKWVEEGNFHLTLYFLGETAPELVPRVREALAGAAVGVAPFSLELGGLGAFPNLSRPRVIWVGANGGEMLIRLQQRAASRLGVLKGEVVPASGYKPHITLGRVRSARNLAVLSNHVREQSRVTVGRQEVTGFSLMESQLSRRGPTYRCLHRWLLAG